MAVAFGHASESHADAASSASQASFTWNHVSTADRCVVVFVYAYATTANPVTTVSFGGTLMNYVGTANASSTESAVVNAYFLDSIVQGATTPIIVNRASTTVLMTAAALSFTAASACEPYGLVQQSNSSTAASGEVAVTDGSPGTNSVRVNGGYTGAASPLGQGLSSTGGLNVAAQNWDGTAYGSMNVYETAAGQGSRNVGFATGTTDDYCYVAFAVREGTARPLAALAPEQAPIIPPGTWR